MGLVPLRLPFKAEAAWAGLGLLLPFPPPLSGVLSLTTSAHSLPYSQSKPEAQRGQETPEGHTASKRLQPRGSASTPQTGFFISNVSSNDLRRVMTTSPHPVQRGKQAQKVEGLAQDLTA